MASSLGKEKGQDLDELALPTDTLRVPDTETCPVYCFWPRIQKRYATRISAHSSDQLIRLIRGWLPILAVTFRRGRAPTVLVVGSQSFLVHSERIVSEENVALVLKSTG